MSLFLPGFPGSLSPTRSELPAVRGDASNLHLLSLGPAGASGAGAMGDWGNHSSTRAGGLKTYVLDPLTKRTGVQWESQDKMEFQDLIW